MIKGHPILIIRQQHLWSIFGDITTLMRLDHSIPCHEFFVAIMDLFLCTRATRLESRALERLRDC